MQTGPHLAERDTELLEEREAAEGAPQLAGHDEAYIVQAQHAQRGHSTQALGEDVAAQHRHLAGVLRPAAMQRELGELPEAAEGLGEARGEALRGRVVRPEVEPAQAVQRREAAEERGPRVGVELGVEAVEDEGGEVRAAAQL